MRPGASITVAIVLLAQTAGGPAAAQSAPAEIEVTSELAVEETGGTLTALVDGVACDTISLADDERVLQLGLPDQPSACGTEGATITFRNGADQQLFKSRLVRLGERQQLLNLAPVPPSDGPPLAPPSVGNAGAAYAGPEPLSVLALAGAVVATALVLGLARRLTLLR